MKRQQRLVSASGLPSRLLGLALLALAASAVVAPAFLSSAWALEAGDASALEKLVVVTDARGAHPVEHQLQVEVMRTDEGRERGLMERRFLPGDRGMLFDFGREQGVMMWMKNTYIPLDMIFMARNGVVTHIAENAEPLSEAIISSQGPAFAVLEVNAGFARKIGLKPGDVVRHALFSR